MVGVGKNPMTPAIFCNRSKLSHADLSHFEFLFHRFAHQANRQFQNREDVDEPPNGTIFLVPALLNLYAASAHYKPRWKDWHAPWRDFCCNVGGTKLCHTDLVTEVSTKFGTRGGQICLGAVISSA